MISKKHYYFVLGWIGVALGVTGIFLPLMPATIFLLMAAWAFAKSSPRWHQWLREHPRFGELICAWEEHRAMPRRAKRIAWLALAISYLFTASLLGPLSLGAIIAGICIAGVAIYIARIPLLEAKTASEIE